MNNPTTPDEVDRAHDLVMELNPYQSLLDVVEYVNRSDRSLAQFQAMMSFILATVKLHPDDMNDALAAAFTETEARASVKWWDALSEEMRRQWLKTAQSAVPADAYRAYLESSRGQG